MPVNFTGTYAAIRAFVLLSLASTPPMAGYSA